MPISMGSLHSPVSPRKVPVSDQHVLLSGEARPSRPVRRLDAAHNVTSIAAPSSARTPGSFVEQPMEHKTPLGIASMASATSTSNQSHSGGVPEEFKATLSRLEEAFARRTFDLENFVKQKVNELTAASTLNSCGDRMKQTTSDLERRCDDMQEALRQLQQKDLTSVAARCEQLESDIAMVRSEHELLQQEQHRKWEVSNVAFGALQNDWENNFKASFADLRQEMEHMKVQSEDVCSEMIQMQRRSDLVSEDTKCLKEKLSRVELSLEQLQDGRRDNIEGDTIKSAMKEVESVFRMELAQLAGDVDVKRQEDMSSLTGVLAFLEKKGSTPAMDCTMSSPVAIDVARTASTDAEVMDSDPGEAKEACDDDVTGELQRVVRDLQAMGVEKEDTVLRQELATLVGEVDVKYSREMATLRGSIAALEGEMSGAIARISTDMQLKEEQTARDRAVLVAEINTELQRMATQMTGIETARVQDTLNLQTRLEGIRASAAQTSGNVDQLAANVEASVSAKSDELASVRNEIKKFGQSMEHVETEMGNVRLQFQVESTNLSRRLEEVSQKKTDTSDDAHAGFICAIHMMETSLRTEIVEVRDRVAVLEEHRLKSSHRTLEHSTKGSRSFRANTGSSKTLMQLQESCSVAMPDNEPDSIVLTV